jgi:predicted HicB family RNase H-like nuclease
MLTFTYHGYFGEVEPDADGDGWHGTLVTESGDRIDFGAPDFSLLHRAVRDCVTEYHARRDPPPGEQP